MVHHPCDILLGQIVKAGTFGKHTADKLMVDFDRTFLVGAAGITVKDAGSPETVTFDSVFPIFDFLGIGEFAAVISLIPNSA